MPRVNFVRSIAFWGVIATVVALSAAIEASGQLPPPPDEVLSAAYQGTAYSPYAGRGFPSRVYWGDTHLHTGLSFDAGAFGNTLGLDEAYRFARGDEVTTSTGQRARLSRPLDFLVVADHSDNMDQEVGQTEEEGGARSLCTPESPLRDDPNLPRHHQGRCVGYYGGGVSEGECQWDIACPCPSNYVRGSRLYPT